MRSDERIPSQRLSAQDFLLSFVCVAIRPISRMKSYSRFAQQLVTSAHPDIPSDVVSDEGLISAMREPQKINAFKVRLFHHCRHPKVM